MNTTVYRAFNRLFKNRFSQRFANMLVKKMADTFSLDLLALAHTTIGVLNYRNEIESGEYYLVSNWLKQFLEVNALDQPCFFDVGANVGNYSKMIFSLYPAARIYAFEPNPNTFNQLQTLSQKSPDICTFNTGLGATVGNIEFFCRQDNVSSSHATLYKDVLTKAHGYTDVRKLTVPIDTLDNFCQQNLIDRIDFLKIDTEGHELKVLEGAKNALNNGIVRSIQFEFNEMNIYSRVFLLDFFEILGNFNLYRLLPTSLLPIQYNSRHEIFLFQNFLAVRKDLDFHCSK